MLLEGACTHVQLQIVVTLYTGIKQTFKVIDAFRLTFRLN